MATKKSKLTVVGSPPSDGELPPKSAGEKLWQRRVMAEWHFTGSGDRELLAQACIMDNRAEMLANVIEADGGPVLYVNKKPVGRPATGAGCGVTYEQLQGLE